MDAIRLLLATDGALLAAAKDPGAEAKDLQEALVKVLQDASAKEDAGARASALIAVLGSGEADKSADAALLNGGGQNGPCVIMCSVM